MPGHNGCPVASNHFHSSFFLKNISQVTYVTWVVVVCSHGSVLVWVLFWWKWNWDFREDNIVRQGLKCKQHFKSCN